MSLDIIIDLKDVSVHQQDNLILSDVNLEIGKGEFVYLIGRVGSGKTSLIKTIYGELPLLEGSGIVAGFSLNDLKRKQIPFLRRKIGVVFQDFQLLMDRTVYDNLYFVLRATGWKNKNENNNRINDVLEKVGLSDKIYKMPHQLSGGEQQRVVIARALLNDPEIILADEPTGNLDPETSEGIIKILLRIKETGRAIIMATHNYTLLKKFESRTLKLEKGKITEKNETETYIDFDSLI